MLRNLFYTWLLILLYCPSFSLFAKEEDEKGATTQPQKKERYLHYSTSLGLGYQSLIYYHQYDNAMESYFTLDAQVVYYPLSFLSLSYTFGVGMLSFFNREHIPSTNQINFPNKVSRFDLENTISLEFYGFVTPSSLMYFGIGGTYIYLGSLNNKDAQSTISSYPSSKKHLFGLHLSLGTRFALYDHTMLSAELYVLLPFSKTRSWSHEGKKIYNQLGLGFFMTVGFFD